MPTLYLAGPIDQVGPDQQTWKQKLVADLEGKNTAETYSKGHQQWTAYDPSLPYHLFGTLSHEDRRAEYIEAVNTVALLNADALVAFIPSNTSTIGTIVELDTFFQKWRGDNTRGLNKPIFVLSNIPYEKSVYLRNRVTKTRYVEHEDKESLDKWMQRAADCIADYYTMPNALFALSI